MQALTWLTTRLTRSARTAAELLFPAACTFCGEMVENEASDASLLCFSCRHKFWPGTGSFCPKCAMPYPELENPTGNCAACRERKPHFDGARTLGVYQLELRQAVLRIKHSTFEPLTMQIGGLLADRLQQNLFDPPPDVVVPVPMHWLKRVWNRTSAAELLAQAVARQLKLPCITDAIRCKRYTQRQSQLPASERWNNVREAFAVGWGFDLRGARVLLVDDVITTGATCSAIARELKRAGAANVYAAAVARSTHMD